MPSRPRPTSPPSDELDRLRTRIADLEEYSRANRHELDVQFRRMAQIQAQLDEFLSRLNQLQDAPVSPLAAAARTAKRPSTAS